MSLYNNIFFKIWLKHNQKVQFCYNVNIIYNFVNHFVLFSIIIYEKNVKYKIVINFQKML